MNDQYDDQQDRVPPSPPPVTVEDVLAAARAAHSATNAPVWDTSELDFRAAVPAGLIADLAARYLELEEAALGMDATHERLREARRFYRRPLECEPPPSRESFRETKPKPRPVPAAPAKPDLFSSVEESP